MKMPSLSKAPWLLPPEFNLYRNIGIDQGFDLSFKQGQAKPGSPPHFKAGWGGIVWGMPIQVNKKGLRICRNSLDLSGSPNGTEVL